MQRSVTFEPDGTILGIREGSEKITISCGEGENKRIEVITIHVKESTLKNSLIKNLVAKYDIKENKLNINLSWDILNGATNYDIYIKNELSDSSKYELYKSITQEDFLEKSNTFISFDIDKDTKEIAYDIYVVGRNEEGTSKPSNIESIRDTIEKEEKKEEEKIEKP